MQERKVWIVWTNTDLTEGRGTQFAIHYCEAEITARRLAKKNYIQGTDCPITEGKLFFDGTNWYGPGPMVTTMSPADQREQAIFDEGIAHEQRRKAAILRARELGLSAEDIALISS